MPASKYTNTDDAAGSSVTTGGRRSSATSPTRSWNKGGLSSQHPAWDLERSIRKEREERAAAAAAAKKEQKLQRKREDQEQSRALREGSATEADYHEAMDEYWSDYGDEEGGGTSLSRQSSTRGPEQRIPRSEDETRAPTFVDDLLEFAGIRRSRSNGSSKNT
ncbi:hypothetical protein L198_08277 [Cryptococcus wingfieldii CBS 7118]|uniref:Uncharacterized protein n=1 Tax=Cryptococcus wingfieldii CBS 7118 TaxID=1295528 RepID=A0A1E3HD00_9TREE|nr:hypothetical protein L198_08277 [Cryptococcus wingfieldii CBS 7118]ODN73626.1 hypothetical protein L198_08277 [Cryptococcus wingfieldii CBS 7118]